MVKSAITWAESKGLARKNAVHGRDEYRVPTSFNFRHDETDRTTTTVSGDVEMQAGPSLGTCRIDLHGWGRCLILLLCRVDEGCCWGKVPRPRLIRKS